MPQDWLLCKMRASERSDSETRARMLIKNHKCFVMPGTSLTVWRYVTFTKLVSLLDSKALYFCRADQLDDPYEGVPTSESLRRLREFGATQVWAQEVEPLIEDMRQQRSQMYLNCWCMSEVESAAMWKLYVPADEGVAIRSHTGALASCLEKSGLTIGLGQVSYIDYDRAVIPTSNGFFPFVHKRSSFAYEQELRAVIWRQAEENGTLISADAKHADVCVDLSMLIDAIHVSPTAPGWLGVLVENVLKTFGLDVKVVRSSLYDRPTY